MHTVILAEKFKPYTRQTIASARQWQWLTPEIQEAVQVVSHVRPFRTNAYVLDQLIDWNNVPDDPMFRLTFGHRDMLDAQQYGQLRQLVLADQDPAAIARCVHAIWMEMHPHRAGQMTRDVPRVSDTPLRGVQHKHAQTVLFSPSPGQACHACGTLYFRCPQCAGMENMAFDSSESHQLTAYLKQHKEVSEVLITGDDPMIMSARSLAAAIDPLLGSGLEHIQSIRIGTKLVANWPQRFVTDRDADDVLRLFERVVAAGKNFVLMGHYSHAVELRQEIAQRAVKRIVATGATLRMQGPLIRHVNDEPNCWAELWRTGVRHGPKIAASSDVSPPWPTSAGSSPFSTTRSALAPASIAPVLRPHACAPPRAAASHIAAPTDASCP